MKKILFLSIVLLSLVACSKGESKAEKQAEKQTEKRDSIITYTTWNDSIVDINNKNVFGATITSNIYGHEGGKIVFDGPVTSIGYEAFYDCSSLTSVTIPNSVTSIGSLAFCDCSSLTSVTIPNSVTSIGGHAFSGCSSLTSVTIPNSVKEIGDGAFWGCSSLTSVTIPNSVTSIGVGAFGGCSSLTSLTIPNSVTSIGDRAFEGCGLLSSPIPPNLMSEEEKIRERNMLEVKINAANELLVEGEILDISQLREKAKEFIVNPNNDENMPELFEEDFGAPFGKIKVTKGHVISLQSAVDTKYEAYLEVQNALDRAYNEIRDECAQKYYHKKYTELDEEQQKKIQEIYPMKISVAKPRKYRVR